MRVILVDHPGGPEVLRLVELPDPSPGAGQIRVVVEYAAVTFIDTQLRAGTSPGPSLSFPAVPGNGVGGVVDAVGPEVDETWLGARVVATTGGNGGYATMALARVEDAHPVPETLALAEATAVLADGRTAIGLHRAAGIGAGEVVVVTAAAGGLGSLLVQLAARSGARVVALAGSDPKLAHATALGAASAVSYRDDAWAEQLRDLAGEGVDVVFDGVGAPVTEALFGLVRSGGRYVIHGAAGGQWGSIADADAAARGVTIVSLAAIGSTPEQLSALIDEALELAASGDITPTIGQTRPLEDAAGAHAAIEARTVIGKTLLRGPSAG